MASIKVNAILNGEIPVRVVKSKYKDDKYQIAASKNNKFAVVYPSMSGSHGPDNIEKHMLDVVNYLEREKVPKTAKKINSRWRGKDIQEIIRKVLDYYLEKQQVHDKMDKRNKKNETLPDNKKKSIDKNNIKTNMTIQSYNKFLITYKAALAKIGKNLFSKLAPLEERVFIPLLGDKEGKEVFESVERKWIKIPQEGTRILIIKLWQQISNETDQNQLDSHITSVKSTLELNNTPQSAKDAINNATEKLVEAKKKKLETSTPATNDPPANQTQNKTDDTN